jgi:6-pyruvoyltetrahydropterin/6-carboxytetrahydropterin synthase
MRQRTESACRRAWMTGYNDAIDARRDIVAMSSRHSGNSEHEILSRGPVRFGEERLMYRVTRALSFCYGHRLLHHPGKCVHLHGHNARAVLTLESDTLDALGMVVDFQVLREHIGSWIDSTLDHRMILHREDPALPALRELGEPVHVVDFNPTAENLARLLFERARAVGLPIVEVELWETPTCKASYRG